MLLDKEYLRHDGAAGDVNTEAVIVGGGISGAFSTCWYQSSYADTYD